MAALALGCSILLDAAWLTVALALILPALAWIERAAGLPALRRVALVVAGVVLVRLVLNPYVAEYAVGTRPVLNMLLVAYGIPAACFGVAAALFRRGGDGLVVGVLEAGACAFGGILLVAEVQHATHGGVLRADDEPGFIELGWWASLLGGYALLLREVALRWGRRVLGVAWRIVGGLGLAAGVALLFVNPFFVDAGVGRGLLINGLLVAYLMPALLALAALWRGAGPRWLLGSYAMLALLLWCSALVRQVFHPGAMSLWQGDVEAAELWAYSGAWFVLAAVVMGAGLATGQRALRLAALALVALVVLKVFLVDMSGLEGLWRVLSFLGLGLGLIGLGAVYRRFGARV